MILCANPKEQYLAHKAEIDEAIKKVLDSGWYVLGSEVKSFEENFATYIGAKYGVGVGSGTEALHIALKALGVGVGEGDEVITVSHTAVATATAIRLAGAEPVFCDINEDDFEMDVTKLEALVTNKTKAIIAVHIYGQAVDMDALMAVAKKFDLKVIEDCAQATGAKYKGKRLGSIGDASCFSFYPTKNLGAIGDGGMVVTNDESICKKSKLLREYGWQERYISSTDGWNSRLDEIQASVLNVKLKYLDEDNAKRKRIAGLYDEGLNRDKVTVPFSSKDGDHVYHLYVIKCKNRDGLLKHLKENGVGAAIHYPSPVHLQSAYEGLKGSDDLKVTEKVRGKILSLPMYPELTEEEVKKVINEVNNFYN